MSLLLPDGITHLADLPHNIHDAIRLALGFLSFEELPQKERPPRHIWLDNERMREWSDMVKRMREEEMKGGKGDDDLVDDPRGYTQAKGARELLVN